MAKKPAKVAKADPKPRPVEPALVGVGGIVDASGNAIRHEASVRSGDDET